MYSEKEEIRREGRKPSRKVERKEGRDSSSLRPGQEFKVDIIVIIIFFHKPGIFDDFKTTLT